MGTLAPVTGRARTALIGIVVLAAALRFPTLDVQSYWADEAATVDVLRHGFGDLYAAVRDQESTPPLYYVLAWIWTQVAGDGEVGLRSLSALAGVATVPVVAAAAARIGGARAGLVGALLVATNPLLVWFSQEARAYSLLVLLSAVSVLLLLRALQQPSTKRLGAWGLVAGLALATHFFALFLVAGEVVWLLWAVRRERRFIPVTLAGPVVAGLALLPLALDQREAGRAGFIAQQPFGERILQVPKQLLVGYDAPAEVILTTVAAALSLVAVAGLLRTRPVAVRPLTLVAVVSVAIPLLLAAAGDDYVVTRNLLATAIPVAVLLAVGLAALPGRLGPVAALLAATLGAGTVVAVQIDPAYQREDWRSAVRALGPAPVGPRAVVVVPGSGRVAVELYLGVGRCCVRRRRPRNWRSSRSPDAGRGPPRHRVVWRRCRSSRHRSRGTTGTGRRVRSAWRRGRWSTRSRCSRPRPTRSCCSCPATDRRRARPQTFSETDGSGSRPVSRWVPRVSPEKPRRVSRSISRSPRIRAGWSAGSARTSFAMRLRIWSAKCGVEAPISSRMSSTVTCSPRRTLRSGDSASLKVRSAWWWSWSVTPSGW